MRLPRAECGVCLLAGPDEFGNYDLLESQACPVHGEAPIDHDSFWSRVALGDEQDCWEWQAGRGHSNYGVVSFNARQYRAHRIAWELANGGPIPDGLLVCHHCDNPPCCNPAHLFLGTNADNAADREAKGRGARGPGSRRKLTETQARRLMDQHRAGASPKELAREFGITAGSVRRLVRGVHYPEVHAPAPVHRTSVSAPSGDEHCALGVNVDDPECRSVPWWQAA